MTRKEWRELAETLRKTREDIQAATFNHVEHNRDCLVKAIDLVCFAIAQALDAEPRFDARRFVADCGARPAEQLEEGLVDSDDRLHALLHEFAESVRAL